MESERTTRLTRRGVVAAAGLALLLGVVAGIAVRPPEPAVIDGDPYRGPGAWIDVFDIVAGPRDTAGPAVTPSDVDLAAASGMRTIFLQGASAEGLLDRDLLAAFLERAHAAQLQVVAWYVPTFGDVDTDLRRLVALHEFSHNGQRFDGLAVDIEFTDVVPDHDERNRRLIDLSRRLRAAVGDTQLGAIVLPPVLLENVNTDLWARFPWQQLSGVYDVWLPMNYWTQRRAASGYRDPVRYTTVNVQRLRERLGDPAAPVHAIGGLAGDIEEGDLDRFLDAAEEVGSVGVSVYDFRTTPAGGLAAFREVPGARPDG